MENNCKKLKICPPKSLRDVVLWHIHNSETFGHLGMEEPMQSYGELLLLATYATICSGLC